MTALKEWLRKTDEVRSCGIFNNSTNLHYYVCLMNKDNLQAMSDLAFNTDKQFDAMVWVIGVSKKTPLFNNTLPIHRKINVILRA